MQKVAAARRGGCLWIGHTAFPELLISPTHPRCTWRRNWWTTSLTSFTTTQQIPYEYPSCPGHALVAPIPRKLSSLNLSYPTPLCRYVKTLHFTWPRDLTDPSAILDCFELSELHTLVVHSCELPVLGERTVRRCFAKFPRASNSKLCR